MYKKHVQIYINEIYLFFLLSKKLSGLINLMDMVWKCNGKELILRVQGIKENFLIVL